MSSATPSKSMRLDAPAPVQVGAQVMLKADDAKRYASLQARCALRGYACNATTDDRDLPLYVVTRWSMLASFESLDGLAAFVSKLDGLAE